MACWPSSPKNWTFLVNCSDKTSSLRKSFIFTVLFSAVPMLWGCGAVAMAALRHPSATYTAPAPARAPARRHTE